VAYLPHAWAAETKHGDAAAHTRRAAAAYMLPAVFVSLDSFSDRAEWQGESAARCRNRIPIVRN
jgi:hypothetical protein